MNLQTLSDAKLLFLCQQYGERTKYWRQKFIGLLPEVYKRKLYEKRKCSSIFEFAAKLAGVSEEQVRRVLNLEKKLQNKPELHKALINGEISINKLRRIAPIVTQENQHVLLEQIKILPQSAIETLVHDERNGRAPTLDLAYEPNLSEEVKRKLYELQLKGIDINELILGAIEERETEISEDKEEFAKEQETAPNSSRHIPRKIDRLIQKEHGTKCSMSNCQNEAEEIHHEIPFALLKNHNPYFLKPLCSAHHILAHRIHAVYEEMRKKAVEVPVSFTN